MSRPRAATSVATRTVEPARLEVGERADALRLALVAVDRGGRDPVALELLGQPVGAVLGPREDERLVDPAARDEVAEQLALALAIDQVDDLASRARSGVLRGVTWTEAGSSSSPSASRRISSENVAEKSRFWRRGRQHGEDLADVADEAHVEHPVGLVEDEDLDPRQVDRPLAEVVEQAAGGRDDDLRPGAQRADLRIEADAAVDGGRADRVAATP